MGNQHSQENIVDRFVRKIAEPFDIHNDCWIWLGGKTGSGYGKFTDYGRHQVCAHRVAHELFIGPIPKGYQVDHLCRNRICVRPDHLKAMTAFENGGQRFRDRTHCKNGHEFNEGNTNYTKERRQCRICGRNAVRRYRMKKEGC